MDSELSLKFIGYFPDYVSVLSRTLLRFFFFFFFGGGKTFVETAVNNSYLRNRTQGDTI